MVVVSNDGRAENIHISEPLDTSWNFCHPGFHIRGVWLPTPRHPFHEGRILTVAAELSLSLHSVDDAAECSRLMHGGMNGRCQRIPSLWPWEICSTLMCYSILVLELDAAVIDLDFVSHLRLVPRT